MSLVDSGSQTLITYTLTAALLNIFEKIPRDLKRNHYLFLPASLVLPKM